jgi:hypothetical protein
MPQTPHSPPQPTPHNEPRRTPFIVRVLLLFPVVASVLFLWWLTRPPPAGLANPMVETRMRRALHGPPDALLVGNSLGSRDIDVEVLTASLGLEVNDAAIKGTSAPTWYVMLRDRVFGPGLRPSLLIVAGTASQILARAPMDNEDRALFYDVAIEVDPGLERRLHGGQNFGRVASRAADLRISLTDGLRNSVAGLLFAPADAGPLLIRGQMVADAAGKAAVGEGGEVAQGLVGWGEVGDGITAAAAVAPERSFVVDIIDLAQAHDAKIVFVNLPTRADVNRTPQAVAQVRELAAYLDQRETVLIDLAGLTLGPEDYDDLLHMSPAGRAKATDELMFQLSARGVLEGNTFTPNELASAPFVAAREGELPRVPVKWIPSPNPCRADAVGMVLSSLADASLRRLGVVGTPITVSVDGRGMEKITLEPPRGCTGKYFHSPDRLFVAKPPDSGEPMLGLEPGVSAPVTVASHTRVGGYTPIRRSGFTQEAAVWWVYPGTATRLELPEGVGTKLHVSALEVLAGEVAPELEVDGVVVPLTVDGSVLRGDAEVGAGSVVRLRSPEGGPWLIIRAVVVDEQWLVGTPASYAAPVEMLPRGDAPVVATYQGTVPVLGQTVARPTEEGPHVIDITEGRWLHTYEVQQVVGPTGCVPVGVQWPGGWAEVRARAWRATFAAPDGVPVESLRAAWQPGRRCTSWPGTREGRTIGLTPAEIRKLRLERATPLPEPPVVLIGERWLYPGDTLTLTRSDLLPLQSPATALKLLAYRLTGDANLHVEVDLGGVPAGVFDLPAAAPGRLDPEFSLTQPSLEPPAEVRLSSDGFVLLRQVLLVEAP